MSIHRFYKQIEEWEYGTAKEICHAYSSCLENSIMNRMLWTLCIIAPIRNRKRWTVYPKRVDNCL